MKFNFSMTVKGLPTADIKCEFECSAEELSMLISDPVYQAIGMKLAEEVSFKRSSSDSGNRPQANHQRHADRNQSQAELRKVEELRKLREVVAENARAQVSKIETLQSLIMRLCRKIDEQRRN